MRLRVRNKPKAGTRSTVASSSRKTRSSALHSPGKTKSTLASSFLCRLRERDQAIELLKRKMGEAQLERQDQRLAQLSKLQQDGLLESEKRRTQLQNEYERVSEGP